MHLINFMSSVYEADALIYNINKDWVVINHLKKYNESLDEIDSFMNTEIASYDSITNDHCAFNKDSWNDMKTFFKSKPLSTMILDLSNTILRCNTCLHGAANPRVAYDPTLGKTDGIFVKLVDALDKGAGNFLQNYTMAKQIAKYECNFMPLFREYLVIQNAIKDGSIMYYFDGILDKLLKEFRKFNYYITNYDAGGSPNACNTKINFTYAYNNSYRIPDNHQSNPAPGQARSFKDAILTYKNALKKGLTDLNILLDAMQGFLDEIYIGVKVLGALNIVFYADPADQDMLKKHSQSIYSSITPPVGQDSDTEDAKKTLQMRAIWAQSFATTLAIDSQQYINDQRTNQSVVFGRTVIAAFTNIGIQHDINLLKAVFDTQHK